MVLMTVTGDTKPEPFPPVPRRTEAATGGNHAARGDTPPPTPPPAAVRTWVTAEWIGGRLRVGTVVKIIGHLIHISMHVIQAKAVGELKADGFSRVGVGAVILVSTVP